MNEGRIKELIKETPVGWTRKHFEDKEKLIRVVAAEAEHVGYRAGVADMCDVLWPLFRKWGADKVLDSDVLTAAENLLQHKEGE